MPSHGPIIGLIVAVVAAAAPLALGQATPDEVNELNQAIGQRVETAVVLGTANSISTGGYKWNLDAADGSITRATWEYNIGNEHPIGQTGLRYIWDSTGGIGYADYKDQFLTGPLAGNQEQFQSYALGSNVGPRVYFSDDISVLPAAGLIYGYTVNYFNGLTNAGGSLIDSSLVNWHVQTLTLTPSIEAQYARTFFGSLKVQARSDFAYYSTFPIERSTDALSFRSNSEVWQNSLDLDYNTGLHPLTCEMHFGGTLSRTDLFDGIQAAIDVDHYYSVGGRITFDTTKTLWILSELGLGATYTWGHGFNGYSIGVIIGVAF